jgi:DNA adenine methylase
MKNNNPTFVKWAGGKTQLLNQFKKYYPDDIDRYFEPFIGSGAVFFDIKKNYSPEYCCISDSNKNLIDLYKTVKKNSSKLIFKLEKYKMEHLKNPKEFYYKQREKYNKTENLIEKSALLLYLNKTCFNGLYRVNSKGGFNVPFGRYKNPAILQKDKINAASKLLQDVEIKHMGFEKILNYAKKGDFVYFDPPYYPLSKTSNFTSYHKDEFLEEKQKQLAKVFYKLHKKGCKLMLSNSNTSFIKNLYNKDKDVKIHLVNARRMINSKATGRGKIKELLVVNY